MQINPMQLRSMTMDKLMTQVELAEELGVTPQTIVAWQNEGLKPDFRRGKFILYEPKKVRRWLYAERERPTNEKMWKKNPNRRGNNAKR